MSSPGVFLIFVGVFSHSNRKVTRKILTRVYVALGLELKSSKRGGNVDSLPFVPICQGGLQEELSAYLYCRILNK